MNAVLIFFCCCCWVWNTIILRPNIAFGKKTDSYVIYRFSGPGWKNIFPQSQKRALRPLIYFTLWLSIPCSKSLQPTLAFVFYFFEYMIKQILNLEYHGWQELRDLDISQCDSQPHSITVHGLIAATSSFTCHSWPNMVKYY